MSSVDSVITIDIRCVGNIDDAVPYINDSVESLSGQSQGIRCPRGSAPHRAISIAFTNEKSPDSQPSF
jgi:hypothetical protein